MKILCIVNPTAGSGRARDMVTAVTRALDDRKAQWKLQLTTAPGDATARMRQARAGSYDAIVAVGGDGTINEVCQGYIDEQGNAIGGPALVVIQAGSGRDFLRTFGPPAPVEQAIARLFTSTPRDVDLGLLRAGAAPRVFANMLSFGVSGVVARRVNERGKWLGGSRAYFLASLGAGLVYANSPLELVIDGELWFRGRAFTVAIANGKYFGGGMMIAPEADPADGAFDVVVLGDLTIVERLALSRRIYRGTHLEGAKVQVTRARSVHARAVRLEDSISIDVDGETPGELPLTAEILPRALRLYA